MRSVAFRSAFALIKKSTVSNLQEEAESLKLSQQVKLESLEAEKDEYIQTIIEMKMRCA